MKSLALFCLFLITATYAANQNVVRKMKQEVMTVGTQCAQKEKVGESDMTRFLGHKWPKTHEGFCAVKCLAEHFGLQNADGTFNREALEKILTPLEDEALRDTCLNIYDNICSKIPFGDDDCENTVELMKCFAKEGEQQGIKEVLGL